MVAKLGPADGVERRGRVSQKTVRKFLKSLGLRPDDVHHVEFSMFTVSAYVYCRDEAGERVRLPDHTYAVYEVVREIC